MVDVRFERVIALPTPTKPNTLYFVKPADAQAVFLYATDVNGRALPVEQGQALSNAAVIERLAGVDAKLALVLSLLAGGITPTPSPSFTNLPTISSDGTPQVGEQLTGVDALTANLGTATVDRAWLLGSTVLSTAATFTPDQVGTFTFRNRIMLGGVVQATVSADVQVAAAAVDPGSFSVAPSITSDGTPQVGEVLGFEFGTANKPFAAMRLYKLVNGSWQDFADASGGAGSVTSEGSYQLWVSLVGSTTIGKSATVAVTAADVVTSVQAPVLSNPSNFVSGTNPPIFKVALNDNTLDKTKYRLRVEWDFSFSGAFSFSSARSSVVEDLMAFADSEDATFATTGDFTAGQVRFRTWLEPKSGSGPISPFSNYWMDTLNAKALPPATTVWTSANGDRKNRWFQVFETAADTGDYRIVNGAPTGANAGGMVNQSRTDARYWEQTVRVRNTDAKGTPGVRLGVCADTAIIGIESFDDPAGLVFHGYTNSLADAAVGDVFLQYYKPATAGANGLFKVWKNGVPVSDQTHSFQGAWRIYNSYKNNDETLLNTGQQPIANVNLITDALDPSAQRYN